MKDVIQNLSNRYGWSIMGNLLKGGNADVYLCEMKEGQKIALKVLRRTDKEAKSRFEYEISFLSTHKDVKGILPILNTDEHSWYTMPQAEPIMNYTQGMKATAILQIFYELCITLSHLHSIGISHRDIKPDNIYYYNGHVCLSDFGLLKDEAYPGMLTTDERGVGAIFTIAPEMLRYPKEADAKKGDVYSVAKTLWILLTREPKGFDGSYYGMNESVGLRYFHHLESEYLALVERLLTSATNYIPELRPTMEQFTDDLQQAIEIQDDVNAAQLAEWSYIRDLLSFGHNVRTFVWTDLTEIVRVMNLVGRTKSANHMMYATGGGLDFEGIQLAAEPGCLKLYTMPSTYPQVIRPKALYYECFESDSWHYFLLDLEPQTPLFSTEDDEEELVLEESLGKYVPIGDFIPYGVYDYDLGNPVPSGAEAVNRLLKGRMLIVLKSSPYNHLTETYDGRHGNCMAQEFRDYMDLGYQYGIHRINCPFKPLPPTLESFSTFSERTETKRLIRKGYSKIKIPLVPSHPSPNSVAEFFVEFKPNFGVEIIDFSRPEPRRCYLAANGKLTCHDPLSAYVLYSRKEAEQQCRVLIQTLQDKFSIASDEDVRFCVKLHMRKTANVRLQFSEQDILRLMTNTDDRKSSKLVVDELGCAHMIPALAEPWNTYSCFSHTFHPRNNECGPYADIMYKDVYTELLSGWNEYVKTGQECRIRFDY